MDADLVAIPGDRPHLVGMQQRGYRRIEERRRHRLAFQQPAYPRRRLANAVLPWLIRIGLGSLSRSGIVSWSASKLIATAQRAPLGQAAGFRLRPARARPTIVPPRLLRPLPRFASLIRGSLHALPRSPCCTLFARSEKSTHAGDLDPALLSAEDMLAAFARRQLSPVDVLQAVTERVARLNPGLNAFAVMNPGALQAAAKARPAGASGRPIGILDGVPCTVKDLVDLAGFPTRRGSRTTSTDPVPDDAPMVVGLKAAGAVILGKTTTTEFGWKSPGDCPLHGITRNPWNPAYTTGGSSSGAGAAGAAGFGPLHIGTDAGGSVRIPAAWCGLVGLKPTYGRIPQWPASAFASVACRRPDDPHGARRCTDVLRHGALGPARPVLPARRSSGLARRH